MTNKTEKWTIARTRLIPCLWPIITYWGWNVSEFLNIKNTGTKIHVFDKGHCTAILEKERIENLGNRMLEIVLENFNKLEQIRKKGIKTGEEVVEYCKNFADRVKKSSIEDFIKFFDGLSVQYPKLMKDNMFYWFLLSHVLEHEVHKELVSYGEGRAQQIFSIMSVATAASYSKKEEQEFEELVKIAKKIGLSSKKVDQEIKKFCKKYFWFPYEYVGPNVWDEQVIRKRIEESMNKKNHEKSKKEVEELQRECIKNNNLNQKIIKLFKIMQIMTLMQDDRKMFNSQVCYYVNGVIISELAKRLDITLEEARYIEQDLIRLYLKAEKAFREKINKRTEFFMVEQDDKSKKFYEGKAAKKRLSELEITLTIEDKNIKEIKGLVANKGFARGKVRILTTSHIEDFNEGDILVTGMTTPDYIVHMKKAAAIITDEGGITSHAAIVSRELNKPCIIGTKIATKVLKDGDLVEVDAHTGVIRRLAK